MKQTILLIILIVQMPFFVFAQSETKNGLAINNNDTVKALNSKPQEFVSTVTNVHTEEMTDNMMNSIDYHDSDFHYRPMDPINYHYYMHPWYSYRSMGMIGGMPYWGLHDGLNVTLGASVFAEFGKGARKGAGFSEQIALTYAHHFALKGGDVVYADGGRKGFTFVGGAYFNNIDYAHTNYRDAGLYGELSYRFDEHWEAAIYGQKSFMDRNMMMPPSLYDMERLGDRIGASVRYNFSPSFSMQLSVETSTRPGPPVPPSPRDRERGK